MDPISLIVIAGIFVIFVVGALAGSSGSPSTITVGTNTLEGTCNELCNQWDARRQERCIAQHQLAVAQARVNTIQNERNAALATAAALTAAAIAAVWIPFAGQVIAAGFLAAAGIAAALAVFLWGELTMAIGDRDKKASAVNAAFTAEAQARATLLAQCEDPIDCLSRPSPC
jgi:hypothetical protein